jgi:hypothetical protein
MKSAAGSGEEGDHPGHIGRLAEPRYRRAGQVDRSRTALGRLPPDPVLVPVGPDRPPADRVDGYTPGGEFPCID